MKNLRLKWMQTLLLLFISLNIIAQQNNPRKYFDYINKAELAICDSNYIEAVKSYKQAFQYLKEPFGKDLFNFLHCGLITADKESVSICLPKYKERNYYLPYWIKDYKDRFIGRYLDSIYTTDTTISKIDTNYRKFIIGLVQKDQEIRRIAEGIPENKLAEMRSKDNNMIIITDSTNMALLKKYIDSTGIFPTESVVGSGDNNAQSSVPYEFLLLHYAYGNVANIFKNPVDLQLDKKVLSGDFAPDLYAHLCDSRGYGIDGKAIELSPIRYGCNFHIRAKRYGNPNFKLMDKSTWQMEIVTEKLSPKDIKAINKRRWEMNMEPYEDLLKKVTYQMKRNFEDVTAFQLVNDWLVTIMFE